jgi:nickel transport protein
MRYLVLPLLLFINIALGHQIQMDISNQKSTVIKLYYPDGTPFSYEQFEIYSPDNDKIPFQVGRTDKYGRIVFIPDKVGKWRIKAISQDGHGINREIIIKKGLLADNKSNGDFYFLKIALSILMIIAIYFLLNKFLRGKSIERKS